MTDFLRRAWAEVDESALIHNFKIIKQTAQSKVCAVVKADAYGHGVDIIAPILQNAGAPWFAVSNVEEAIELRELGITKPILILGYTPCEYVSELAAHNVSQCVYSLDYARELSQSATQNNLKINIHLKLDTGMSRIGFNCRNEESDVLEIEKALLLDNLKYTGVFMHFASADSNDASDVDFTKLQFERFMDTVSKLEQKGFNLLYKI